MSLLSVGDVVLIEGLGSVVSCSEVYSYSDDKTSCPRCGEASIVWRGWLTCEFCPTVALVSTGQVFERGVLP